MLEFDFDYHVKSNNLTGVFQRINNRYKQLQDSKYVPTQSCIQSPLYAGFQTPRRGWHKLGEYVGNLNQYLDQLPRAVLKEDQIFFPSDDFMLEFYSLHFEVQQYSCNEGYYTAPSFRIGGVSFPCDVIFLSSSLDKYSRIET